MTDQAYAPDAYAQAGPGWPPLPFPGEDGGRDLLGMARPLTHQAGRGPATEYEYNQKSHRNGMPAPRPYTWRAGDAERDAWMAAMVAEAQAIAARRVALTEGP